MPPRVRSKYNHVCVCVEREEGGGISELRSVEDAKRSVECSETKNCRIDLKYKERLRSNEETNHNKVI
jgi:hypothetical protein